MINAVLNRMESLLTRFRNLRRGVVFENVKIYHETDSAILVELEDQSVWLPKAKIEMQRTKKKVTITIPFWLLKKKFPSEKYTQFIRH